MKRILSALSLAALATGVSFAQTTLLTPTTLSAAMADNITQTLTVASATGFTAGSTDVFVDRELMAVLAVNGNAITVQRGIGGTTAAPHLSGALAFVATPSNFFFGSYPSGSCTRSAQVVLPHIHVLSGIVFDCLGGQWISGGATTGATTEPRWRVYAPEPGATAYTSINSTGTTEGATTLYCSEVWLPQNKLLTGIALLNGTTVGTDKRYVVLYDNAGNALANSALAGALTATASVYQAFAFTSTYFAVGPAQYFACFQANGTTDSFRAATTGTNDNILTKGQTGATFGTVPALTVPTSFNSAVGPYVYLY
jgi:hypothetical protein